MKGRLSPVGNSQEQEEIMVRRTASLTVIALLAACAMPALAQQSLGDFVSNNGYDWVIGRWVATTDQGQVELNYRWALDKYVVLGEVKMGDYRYRGIIMLDPGRGEVVETGADNRGGTAKGEWTEENGDLVHRIQHTGPNGEVMKAQIVYTRVDADNATIAMYRVDSSGYRSGEPMAKATYKRQPAATTDTATATQGGPTVDYEKLGDLVSQGGSTGWPANGSPPTAISGMSSSTSGRWTSTLCSWT